jgi:hypothetical protein
LDIQNLPHQVSHSSTELIRNNILQPNKDQGAPSQLIEDKKKDFYVPENIKSQASLFKDIEIREDFNNDNPNFSNNQNQQMSDQMSDQIPPQDQSPPPSQNNGCWIQNDKYQCIKVPHAVNQTCYNSLQECQGSHPSQETHMPVVPRHPHCPTGTECIQCDNGDLILGCPTDKRGCYHNSKYFCPLSNGDVKKCQDGTTFKCYKGAEGCYDNSGKYCGRHNKMRISCGKEGGAICSKHDKNCRDFSSTYCYNFSGTNPKIIKCKDGSYRVCPSEDANCQNNTNSQYCASQSLASNLDSCYKEICMPYKHLICDS